MKTHLLPLNISSEKLDMSDIDGNMNISKYRDEIRHNMFLRHETWRGNFILTDIVACNPAGIIIEYVQTYGIT